MSAHDDDWYRAKARETLHRDGELEFDEGATVSTGADKGAYVQCWAWVEDEVSEEVCDAT